MNDKIRSLILHYEQDGDFTRVKLTDAMLEEAQNQLGLTIPSQFVDYLAEFSHGGIAGVVIMGVGLNGSMVFVEATLNMRTHGLPESLLVVENCDEWLYCIDCSNGAVVSWEIGGEVKQEFECFDDFLLSEYSDAIENL
jgi:hypothetical protein